MTTSTHKSTRGRQYCLRGEIGGAEQIFELAVGENQLGALETNEVVIPLVGVSRVHALLRLRPDGQLEIEDLGSKNGTFVGSQRIDQGTAAPGSDLRFGPVGLRYEEFHRDDGKLAIAFDLGSTHQTGVFPIQEVPRHTGTHISSLTRQWLQLAEAFQDRLLYDPDGDLTPALGLLHEEMHLETVCVLELPETEGPVVINAIGRVDDRASRELREALVPFLERPAGREIYYDTLHDDQDTPLTLAAQNLPGVDPLVLALWGRFPGRLDAELFFRLLLRMIEARRSGHRPEPTESESGEAEFPGLIVPPDYVYGRSEAMRQIYDLMQTLAQGDLPVLIIGETGVGKEYLAQILHGSSPRRRGPFIAINCAAIPAELLEAELFGIGEGVATGVSARKGRFQLADGGTLFLDEIGDMSADLQAKLLRALQEKEVHPLGKGPASVDVRVLGATNQELANRISDGSFRADLYYRLAGYVLEIPPLRDRREDIPDLVEHFMRECSKELNRPIRGLTVHALRMLGDYPWPGNVRELSNEVRRAVYLCPENGTIESATLSKALREHYAERGELPEEEPLLPSSANAPSSTSIPAVAVDDDGDQRPGEGPDDSKTLDRPIGLGLASLDLEELESTAIREALRRCDGNQVQAAKLLGISRQKLRRRMERMGLLDPPGSRTKPGAAQKPGQGVTP